jgi:small subunit ribosomal protein S5
MATFEALKMTSRMRVTDEQAKSLNIVSGPTGIKFAETDIDAEEE